MLSGGAHDNLTSGRGGSIILDPGSDEHVWRPTFAPFMEVPVSILSFNS